MRWRWWVRSRPVSPTYLLSLKRLAGDIDVQLYGNTRLVVWDPNGNHGLLSGPTQESVSYAGMTITYSGYNGRAGNWGLSTFELWRYHGTANREGIWVPKRNCRGELFWDLEPTLRVSLTDTATDLRIGLFTGGCHW